MHPRRLLLALSGGLFAFAAPLGCPASRIVVVVVVVVDFDVVESVCMCTRLGPTDDDVTRP